MTCNYPKEEKLKSKKQIGLLFTEGQSVSKYPLRLVYAKSAFEQNQKIQLGVSVSKKNFKRAVDRNYFKRVLRECYRNNKHLLHNNVEVPYSIMFFYQTKEKLAFDEINSKTIALFEKFLKEISNKD
jgi:ribonuclease P protein component